MERVREMIERCGGGLGAAQVEKGKCNEVHLVEWNNGRGEEGSAWVQTKGQLAQIVGILREKPGMAVTVQGYLVPRDKTMLTKWLNECGVKLPKPFSELKFVGSAPVGQ